MSHKYKQIQKFVEIVKNLVDRYIIEEDNDNDNDNNDDASSLNSNGVKKDLVIYNKIFHLSCFLSFFLSFSLYNIALLY